MIWKETDLGLFSNFSESICKFKEIMIFLHQGIS